MLRASLNVSALVDKSSIYFYEIYRYDLPLTVMCSRDVVNDKNIRKT